MYCLLWFWNCDVLESTQEKYNNHIGSLILLLYSSFPLEVVSLAPEMTDLKIHLIAVRNFDFTKN